MTRADSHKWRRPGKRLVMWLIILLFFALFLAHFAWTRHERSKLMAVVQEYRSAGEPVMPEDFAPPASDDPDNPAPQWRAAATAFQGHGTKLLAMIEGGELSVPLSDSEDQLLRALLDQNQAALRQADAAGRMHGRPDWRIQLRSPAIATALPDLNPQRVLSRLLAWSALDAHHHHDDALAADRLLEMLAQARAVQHQPGIVGHLVAAGLETLACETARTIGPELQISPSPDPSAKPASPAQIRQLISELLDDRPLREGQILAYRSERMFELDTTLQVAAGQLNYGEIAGSRTRAGTSPVLQGIVSYIMAPIIYDDGRFLIRHTTQVLKAAQSPDFVSAQTALDSLPSLEGKRGAAHVVVSVLRPAFERAVLQDFRTLTEKRLAAVLLACRWYAADHGGEFPRKLDDLVPAYLPAIPADPFTSGSPLHYRPGAIPIIYSVGENQQDDGGSEQPFGKQRPGDRWVQLDFVTHLTLQRHAAPPQQPGDEPATPATTEPATAPVTQPALP